MPLEVAQTILAQLGGSHRLNVMVGAHSFVGDATSLSFHIKARAQRGIKRIRVALTPADLYDVQFYKWSRNEMNWIEIDHVSMTDVGSLFNVLESNTGLAFRM